MFSWTFSVLSVHPFPSKFGYIQYHIFCDIVWQTSERNIGCWRVSILPKSLDGAQGAYLLDNQPDVPASQLYWFQPSWQECREALSTLSAAGSIDIDNELIRSRVLGGDFLFSQSIWILVGNVEDEYRHWAAKRRWWRKNLNSESSCNRWCNIFESITVIHCTQPKELLHLPPRVWVLLHILRQYSEVDS